MELTTSAPKPGHGQRAQAQDIALIHHQAVLEDWTSGYRVGEISARQGLSIAQVNGAIRSIRKQLYEDNQATLSEHAEQSVAILRRLQTKLWQEFDQVSKASAGLQILDLIRKTEESVAKIRGVLSNRVIADVIHHVKMYDFKDKFPNENGRSSDEASNKILESESYELSPVSKNEVPDSEPYSPEKPDFDEDNGVVMMPNGDIIDVEKAIKGEW